jgi:putative Ca2+/H+ antiporter (TMEM165/GDT1 family)
VDALLTAFVTATLAEWGDKTQLIVVMLAAATRRPLAILGGLILAAAVSSAVASIAGVYIAGQITIRAMSLMVALALLFGGLSGLIRRREPSMGNATRWPLVAAFILCLAAEMADRTQFLTFALAGRFGSAPLAAAGATAGIAAACAPAALLGDRLKSALPVRAIRYAVAGLFLLSGFIVAVNALRLT